tara:strand:- start:2356 stop:2796 length:441 start_codon:yes stop_codon:yes gene_type:complete
MKVSRDIPLAEITLRKYEKPYEMPKRDLVRKICLSTGLLQPGDSRDVIVDIFYVLLYSKEELDSESVRSGVIEFRKENKLPMVGIAGSNVRRQLKRLRDMYFVEKVKNRYRIAEKERISHIFEQKIEKFYLQAIVSRVKEYIDALE